MNYLIAFIFLSLSFATIPSYADDVYRIKISKDYEKSSDRDLRRRVFELERAVAQLQMKVFELQVDNKASGGLWTCSIQSFATTHVSSGHTKAAALAQVLKKCSDASNAIHCKEADVSCGNE